MLEKHIYFGSHHHYWVSLEFGSKVKVFCFFFEYLHLSSILAANFFESLYVCSPLLKRKEVSVFHTTLFRGWLSDNSVGFEKKKLSVARIPISHIFGHGTFLVQNWKPNMIKIWNFSMFHRRDQEFSISTLLDTRQLLFFIVRQKVILARQFDSTLVQSTSESLSITCSCCVFI